MRAWNRPDSRSRDPSVGRAQSATRSARPNSLWRHVATRTPATRWQAKLEVGSVRDPAEHEAERVSETVLRAPGPSADAVAASGSAAADRHGAYPAGGQALPASTRAYFEPRFGRDFGDVRVHADSEGAESARGLGARAYTIGSDIVFGHGQYAPHSREGNKLLAHELAHVVQQRASGRPRLQRSPGPGDQGALTEPDVGSLTFRWREDGGLELVLGLPDAPGLGVPGIGARRDPNGRWQLVIGRNPVTGGDTYSWEELLDLVRGMGPPGAPAPGGVGPMGTPPPPPAPPQVSPPEEAPRLTLREPRLAIGRLEHHVVDRFAFNDATPPAVHSGTLAWVATRIFMHGPSYVGVVGHTDSVGPAQYNLGLGQRRADAVKDALIRLGVEGSVMKTDSRGESELAVDPERSRADRARNRRVEIFWVRPATPSPRPLETPSLKLGGP